METAPTQHMTLIVLSGALLAAVAVAVVIYLVPGFTTSPATPDIQTQGTTGNPNGTSTQFNTEVLQRQEYRTLDTSLFVRGLLPVQPPTGSGKKNVFQ